MRKGVMAIAAALALGAATMATGVTAAPHGGGGGGGGGGGAHFSGGGGGASFGGNAHMGGGGAPMAAGPRSGGTFNGGATFNSGSRFSGARTFNSGPRFSGGNFATGGHFGHFHHRHFHGGVGLFAFGGPGYWDSCWRLRRVWTPWGWHWRRINVCW